MANAPFELTGAGGGGIAPPAQGILQRIVLGLILELGRDADQIDAAQGRCDRLLTLGLQQLVAQTSVALDLPG
ncbi:hypothetical protein IVB18_38100 [Bradyrhizobium sp. 186]|uniref:hypothetical protein n=1 Tax=Bradyrhizobium sp. 186 TaxID=2782654 RepID=UPI002000F09C|nr:hypothetical protein [Bradyrhizobium sp. 186]UPK33937.1 hypothetical protein IVB18_38100 [Bradyrhizobium sp. 186]